MTDTIPTIELFPGVQFRRGTPRDGSNQCWEFFADNGTLPSGLVDHRRFSSRCEGSWLPARHAYADDVVLDHLARILDERNIFAASIIAAATECGHISPEASLNGPQILMVLADMVTAVKEAKALRPDAERYRSMRDCQWPGAMQQVGIVHRDNDTVWLHGDEADRKVDAAMDPPVPQVIVFAAISAPLPTRGPVQVIAAADRKCHEPECYDCDGTGFNVFSGSTCSTNKALPF